MSSANQSGQLYQHYQSDQLSSALPIRSVVLFYTFNVISAAILMHQHKYNQSGQLSSTQIQPNRSIVINTTNCHQHNQSDHCSSTKPNRSHQLSPARSIRSIVFYTTNQFNCPVYTCKCHKHNQSDQFSSIQPIRSWFGLHTYCHKHSKSDQHTPELHSYVTSYLLRASRNI